MHLTVIKPSAEITSLDLDVLPVWQFRMEVVPGPAEGKASLALGFRYLAPGTRDGTAFVQVLSIDCKCSPADLAPVIRIGFPPEREAAKDRLLESMKVLYNSPMSAKDVESILPKAGSLIDAYFSIRQALFGQSPGLGDLGPLAKGDLDGYRWIITRKRFESWLLAAGADAPPAPGKEPEELKPGAGTIPPPPGSEKPKKAKDKGHGSAPVE